TIARVIEQRSDAFLQVEQGSLYPALNRLEDRGWIDSYWATSDHNRRARYYRLTPKGRRQLQLETEQWSQLVHAIGRGMRAPEEGTMRRFFRRGRLDAERAREIQAHLDHYTDDLIAAGYTRDRAQREARRRFGNPTAIREEIYEMNSVPVIEPLVRDLRFAV